MFLIKSTESRSNNELDKEIEGECYTHHILHFSFTRRTELRSGSFH